MGELSPEEKLMQPVHALMYHRKLSREKLIEICLKAFESDMSDKKARQVIPDYKGVTISIDETDNREVWPVVINVWVIVDPFTEASVNISFPQSTRYTDDLYGWGESYTKLETDPGIPEEILDCIVAFILKRLQQSVPWNC